MNNFDLQYFLKDLFAITTYLTLGDCLISENYKNNIK